MAGDQEGSYHISRMVKEAIDKPVQTGHFHRFDRKHKPWINIFGYNWFSLMEYE